MNDEQATVENMLADPATVERLLSLIGLDSEDREEIVQEDGTLVIPIDDRAVAVEHQEDINSVAITGFVASTAEADLPLILQDLLTLNAQPKETGGLFFGLLEENVVATLLLPDVFAKVENVASAVSAVAESCGRWEQVIESAKSAVHAEIIAERERTAIAAGPSAGYV